MRNNPYKILGVSPTADDEEIRKAYHELARKYHPDRYHDSELAEIASEKMKEINAAYEEIQRLRAGQTAGGPDPGAGRRASYAGRENPYTGQGNADAGRGSADGGGAWYGANYEGSRYSQEARAAFTRIRNAINAGDIAEAERLLDEIAEADRGAEWFFLTGCVQMRKGHYVDAQRSFDTAYRMEPSNNEYWTFKEKLHDRAKNFGGGYDTRPASGCSGCDVCSSLICADCCCECFGGDLIPCC